MTTTTENMASNERSFYDACLKFYKGEIASNPTVTNMTSFGVPHMAALAIIGMAKKQAKRDKAKEARNADGRTQHEQAALERRARFVYDHDCD